MTWSALPQAPPPGHCHVTWLADPLPEEDDEAEPVPCDALRVRDRGAPTPRRRDP